MLIQSIILIGFVTLKVAFLICHKDYSVASAIGASVNPLQNRATEYVNIVLECLYQFFE